MLKALLRTRLHSVLTGFMRNGNKNKTRSPIAKVGVALLLLYVVGCMFWLFGMLWEALCEPLYRLDLAWLYFALVGVMTTVLCFISSVFAAQTQLFSAKDNELLLSMPIPPRYIVISRMASLLLLNYMFAAAVVLPAAFVWLYSLPASATGIIIFAIAFIALPFIALTLSCFFGWVLAAIVARIGRGKNYLTMLLSMAFLAVYFIVYSRIQEYVGMLISNGSAIAEAIERAVPPFFWLGSAIASGNWLHFALFLLCCAVPFGIAFALISRSFISIATRRTSGAKRVYRAGAMKVESADTAMLKKELSHLTGSAMYMMNAGMGLVMLLIACVALVIKRNDMLALIESMNFEPGDMTALLLAAQCYLSSMVIISAPTISLEGRSLWIMQSLPVDAYRILRSKVRLHTVVACPFMLIASAVICAVSGAAGFMIPLSLILPCLFTQCFAQLGVLINLRMPKFDWINETVAVKQSMATLVAMFANMGIVIAPTLVYALVLAPLMSLELFLAVLGLVLILVCILLDRVLRTGAAARFAELNG